MTGHGRGGNRPPGGDRSRRGGQPAQGRSHGGHQAPPNPRGGGPSQPPRGTGTGGGNRPQHPNPPPVAPLGDQTNTPAGPSAPPAGQRSDIQRAAQIQAEKTMLDMYARENAQLRAQNTMLRSLAQDLRLQLEDTSIQFRMDMQSVKDAREQAADILKDVHETNPDSYWSKQLLKVLGGFDLSARILTREEIWAFMKVSIGWCFAGVRTNETLC
ncbi:hypothetical protein BDY21DRAFT_345813 [Lineolata rhizophorae]|uniref:Uncharacterized protein n=1 Tax=Lineolata rhizophorae TaxID=578093 RepID=A0A6A6NYN8_9PEZI|nr:hypothetical protein BDY21DRAFT_345813 [Lineolata rhizophorae]